MGQLLFVGFFLVLFVVAPVKAAAIFAGAFLLAALVVQATASSVSRTSVSLTDSFKALVYAVFFTLVGVFTIFSFMVGAPKQLFMNPAAVSAVAGPLLALQYGSYALGFKIALGLTFIQAAIVAVASTVITSGAMWFIVKLTSSPG